MLLEQLFKDGAMRKQETSEEFSSSAGSCCTRSNPLPVPRLAAVAGPRCGASVLARRCAVHRGGVGGGFLLLVVRPGAPSSVLAPGSSVLAPCSEPLVASL